MIITTDIVDEITKLAQLNECSLTMAYDLWCDERDRLVHPHLKAIEMRLISRVYASQVARRRMHAT